MKSYMSDSDRNVHVKALSLGSVHTSFSHIHWLPSSLWLVLPRELVTGDKIKHSVTLKQITDFSELNIVGNIWDHAST